MPAAVWQILNMKHMQWPKTCWNLPEKKSWNHIKWTYFWLNSKSEPKNWLKKNREIEGSYCNNFEYERRAKTGNGNQVNLLFWEKLVKSHQVNLFLAVFSYFEHVSRRAATQSWRSAHQTRKGDGLSTPEAITRVSIYLTPYFLYDTQQGKTRQETQFSIEILTWSGSHKDLSYLFLNNAMYSCNTVSSTYYYLSLLR